MQWTASAGLTAATEVAAAGSATINGPPLPLAAATSLAATLAAPAMGAPKRNGTLRGIRIGADVHGGRRRRDTSHGQTREQLSELLPLTTSQCR
jgi:hypothetical protein